MTVDALKALQRHFEEEYGILDLRIRKKKRKYDQIELEPQNEIANESEEEWQGILSSVDGCDGAIEPQVVSFAAMTETTEDAVTSYKSFMVY